MKFIYKFIVFFLIISFIAPVISFADDFYDDENISSDVIEVTSSFITKDVPSINARHAVILDRASGTVIYVKNENEKCKMASTTKILTAIIVIENSSDLSTIVSVSSKASHTGRFKIGAIYRW